MSLPKHFCRSAAVLCALSLITGVIHADDSSATKNLFLPRNFEAALKNGEVVGFEQVRRVFITSGTNEFLFVVPQGLRMDTNPDKLTLVATDSSYFLTFRVLRPAVPEANTSNLGSARRYVSDLFPQARILEEFFKTAAGRNGPAFDIRLKAAGGMERALCVVLVPSEAGVLEFTLNADLSKSAEAKAAFHSLLRTFRSNERGKLEVTPRVVDNS